MRRYRGQGELRKLAEAPSARLEGSGHPRLADDQSVEASDNNFAVVEAAAAIASAKVGQRMSRFFVLVVGVLGLVVGGLAVLANQAIDQRVEKKFEARSNAVFGFVTVQRNILELDRYFESELGRVSEITDPEAGESAMRLTIDQATDDAVGYLSRFRSLANGEDVTINGLTGYVPSETDLYALQYNLTELMDKISYHARGISYYQPIVGLGLANPEIAREARRFRRDFAYASGVSLLSEPSLPRDLSSLKGLYDEHLRMLRELTNWPEYALLFGLLIEDQLGSSNEELRVLTAGMQDLSPADFGSLIDTIAEIGIDGSANEQYRLAADRTYATLMDGCDGGNFIPGPVCAEIKSSGVLSVFPSATPTESLTSVGLNPSTAGSLGADAWSASLGGQVAASTPADKPVPSKGGRREPVWRD
ncbi:MAG: hypothetical protein AAFR65_16120 [Pseudomonadota bacterium]